MYIEELIDNLQKIKKEHGNIPVFLSIDPEGNAFNDVYCIEESHFARYGSEIDVKHPEDVELDDKRCVVIWP